MMQNFILRALHTAPHSDDHFRRLLKVNAATAADHFRRLLEVDAVTADIANSLLS